MKKQLILIVEKENETFLYLVQIQPEVMLLAKDIVTTELALQKSIRSWQESFKSSKEIIICLSTECLTMGWLEVQTKDKAESKMLLQMLIAESFLCNINEITWSILDTKINEKGFSYLCLAGEKKQLKLAEKKYSALGLQRGILTGWEAISDKIFSNDENQVLEIAEKIACREKLPYVYELGKDKNGFRFIMMSFVLLILLIAGLALVNQQMQQKIMQASNGLVEVTDITEDENWRAFYDQEFATKKSWGIVTNAVLTLNLQGVELLELEQMEKGQQIICRLQSLQLLTSYQELLENQLKSTKLQLTSVELLGEGNYKVIFYVGE